MTSAKTTEFLRSLQRLTLSLDQTPAENVVMVLARRHTLTVYDCGYLELALRRGLPLTTLDKKLAAAARIEGVRLIG
jgi:predicted nucleic acid-binding protein